MTTDERFERIEQAIAANAEATAGLQQTMSGVLRSIAGLQETVAGLQVSVAKLQESVAGVQQSVAGIQQSLNRLTEYVLDFRQETAARFQLLESKVDFALSTGVESRLQPVTKALVDFGNTGTYLFREQSHQKDVVAELIQRVTNLEKLNSAA